MLLYADFLHDDSQYEASERFWRDLWSKRRLTGEWSSPWLRTTFADGTRYRDGNPIFSAYSRDARRAVKVIQAEAEQHQVPLSAWVQCTEDEDGAPIYCLALHCVLSEDSAERAAAAIDRWLTFAGDPTRFNTEDI